MALVATVDATGIRAPTFEEVRAELVASYRSIYGADVYLEPDSQDGQWLSVLAQALHDTNSMAVAVYNQFAPSTAQGEGLSSVVLVNGIARQVPSRSSVDLLLTGQVGTVIVDGLVEDETGQRWALPASVTIPGNASVIATATAVEPGALVAPAGTVNRILNPTRGWQSATNPAAATPGAPVESDAQLRARQRVSVSLPSRTALNGIIGAVANVPGVGRYRGYENDTSAADANGQTARSIAIVVEGGSSTAIAQAIQLKKTPGVRTAGFTTVDLPDSRGTLETIRFFRPTIKDIAVRVTIKALPGYTTPTADLIKAAVAESITASQIGDDVVRSRLYLPAQLRGGPGSETFDIVSIQLAIKPATPADADVVISYIELARCAVADVTIVVTT